MATYEQYLAKISSQTRKLKVKIVFLRDEDETDAFEFTEDLDSSTGSVSAQRQNGVRRTCDLTLINNNGDYFPSFDGGIWWRRKFQVFMGIDCQSNVALQDIGEEDVYWISQGVFCLENPRVISNFSSKTVTIRGSDKFCVIDGTLGGETDGTYIVPVGTNILTAVQAVLDLVGDKKAPILDSTLTSNTTPYTIEIPMGGNLSEVLIQLAGMVSANVYYNTEGQLVFAVDELDNTKPSLFDFSQEDFLYMGASQEYKFSELYNSVLVVGDNINGQIFDMRVQYNNLLSPVSIPNMGFERVKVIEDPNIYSDALSLLRAEYELKRLVCLQSAIDVSCVPVFHLDVDQVFTLTDLSMNLDSTRFLINSFTVPLQTSGSMSLNSVAVQEVDFS